MPRFSRFRSAGRFKRFRRRYSKRGRFQRSVRRIAYSISEKKYWDYLFNVTTGVNQATWAAMSTTNLSNDWANQVSLLATMPQGNAEGQRIGNRIHVKYIQMSMFFRMDPNAGSTGVGNNAKLQGMFCRYMLLLDKQPGGTALPRTVMSTGPGVPVAGLNVIGGATSWFKEFNMLRRFKTLLDAQHQRGITSRITGDDTTATQPTMTGTKVIQHYIKIGRTFTFTGVGSATDMKTAGSVMQDGDLLLQVCPSEAACCACFVSLRVCYTDA